MVKVTAVRVSEENLHLREKHQYPSEAVIHLPGAKLEAGEALQFCEEELLLACVQLPEQGEEG